MGSPLYLGTKGYFCMKDARVDPNPKPPEHLYPPKDHTSEGFKIWCAYVKKLGYADQYIAAVSGESVNRIRRLIGRRKRKH